jgi:hypothetical protein
MDPHGGRILLKVRMFCRAGNLKMQPPEWPDNVHWLERCKHLQDLHSLSVTVVVAPFASQHTWFQVQKHPSQGMVEDVLCSPEESVEALLAV